MKIKGKIILIIFIASMATVSSIGCYDSKAKSESTIKSNNAESKIVDNTKDKSDNKVDNVFKCSKTVGDIKNISLCGMFNDISLKESKDSNINASLSFATEGKDKDRINKIIKSIELKIDEKDNGYVLNLYRNGENLIITTKEMEGIDYINFNLNLEIPKSLKSITFGNLGTVKFDNLNLDKIDISARGDITGTNITSKDCTLLANDSVIQVDKFNADKLFIRTHNKLRSREITSKDCTLVTNRAVVEVDKFNCDKIDK